MAARKPVRQTGSSSEKEQVGLRRIVVGLDTSFMAREALALAARVAASVDAGLRGVFVEDENLLALSALPFAREVSFSGEVRALDEGAMLRAMQAQAETARRILERVAADAHVQWSFDIARGRPLASLAAAATADDTLIIRAHAASRHEVGRAVRAATRDARADVLLAARGVAVSGAFAPSVVPARQGVESSVRPLAAIDEGTSLGEGCSAFGESLARRIGAPFRRIYARGFAASDVAVAARNAGAGLIVVNAAWLGDDDDAARLSAAAGCPVLLLGGERGANLKTPSKP
ncbi:MAG: hypothetical protein K8R18_09955 [Parvibaculum sp.]|uniref:hypothetical protein n=1 Tax=Parvibaculum sp. TaxID=2024848 RepID=UPI0025D3851E|nr:hypothetical protein [Parvibaculum sp.]MCE9649933.1 hypothetical protein [Parvibaculum sp.]